MHASSSLLVAMAAAAVLIAGISAEKTLHGHNKAFHDEFRPGPYRRGPYGRHHYAGHHHHHHRGDFRNDKYYDDGRPYYGRGYDGEIYGPPRPYEFSYNAEDGDGAHGHSQVSDGRGVRGQYTIQLADGRSRRVDYVADEGGFRAKVDTNEPGTESKDAADAEFRSTALPGDEAAIRFGPRPGRYYGGHGGFGLYGRGFDYHHNHHHGDRYYNNSKRGFKRW